MGPLNWRPLLMPLNLIKRSERTSAITSAEHDGNFQAIEDSLNGIETQLDGIETVLESLGAGSGAKIANIVEDTTPELGGDLDGLNKAVHQLRARMVSKAGSFTADPTEAAVYNIQSPIACTMTLPSDMTLCPVGTGFEVHIEQNIEVDVVTSSGDLNHVVNFSGHKRLKGPLGQGFVRVLGPDGTNGVWKLIGTTAPQTTNPSATPAQWLANPFGRNSPQHRPIGTNAIYTQITQSLNRISGAGFNVDNGGGTNIYTMAPGDPVRTVTADGSVSGNTGLPVSLKVPASVAIGGSVNDRTLILFDPDTFICHQFYHWGTSVTSPTAGRYVKWDIRGIGVNVGTSASKKAALMGLNRAAELSTPGTPILHVQEVSVNRFGSTAILNRNVVWPAFGKDFNADDADNNQGELPYGALLAIPPTSKGGPTKSSLGLSELGGRLFDQFLGFGMYLFDGTSSTNMVFRGDQFSSSAVQTDFKAEMNKLKPYLRWVSNNAEDQTASGGGSPLATPAPLG